MTSADSTHSHFSRWLFFLVLPLIPLLISCNGDSGVSRLSGRTMGTSWNVSYLPAAQSPGSEILQRDVTEILSAIDSRMSTYRQSSEISRFNTAEAGIWFPVSPVFFEVLEAALLIGEASNGAYDVTVGPLVDRWGFGPGHTLPNVPDEEEIKVLLQSVGQDKLQLDPAIPAVLKPPGLSLDFSSIAKGYAVDKVAEYLQAQQIDNFLVEVGGEIRLSGRSGRGDEWRIAIEQPDGGAQAVAEALTLTDVAVATSGDYRNYFELNDQRYSHSIDPVTGHPIEHDLVSVTVIHSSAMMADGWATALTVMGEASAIALAEQLGLAVYFIRREDDRFVSSQSEAFAPYLHKLADGE
jgi:thiamine biosynthesis lipoprotein